VSVFEGRGDDANRPGPLFNHFKFHLVFSTAWERSLSAYLFVYVIEFLGDGTIGHVKECSLLPVERQAKVTSIGTVAYRMLILATLIEVRESTWSVLY
jgi:hypothetical protein